MATTTATPEIKPQEAKKAPVSLTPTAIAKVREIMAQQNPVPAGLRMESSAAVAPASPTPCSSKMERE